MIDVIINYYKHGACSRTRKSILVECRNTRQLVSAYKIHCKGFAQSSDPGNYTDAITLSNTSDLVSNRSCSVKWARVHKTAKAFETSTWFIRTQPTIKKTNFQVHVEFLTETLMKLSYLVQRWLLTGRYTCNVDTEEYSTLGPAYSCRTVTMAYIRHVCNFNGTKQYRSTERLIPMPFVGTGTASKL